MDKLVPPKDRVHFVMDDGYVKLTVGAPGPRLLNMAKALFAKAAAVRLADPDETELYQYGPEEGPTSYLYQLSLFLSEVYSSPKSSSPVKVDWETLFLTTGASYGLELLLEAFVGPMTEAVVFVENPTYFLFSTYLDDLGGCKKIVPLRMQPDGVDVDQLEEQLARHHLEEHSEELEGHRRRRFPGKFWAVYYSVPTFNNPTGVCLSPEKSRKVVQLARKYDILVICDDVYNILDYGASATPEQQQEESSGKVAAVTPRLVAYDHPEDPDYGSGHVVSNGSFSKIWAPGFRVGWIEASKPFVQRLRRFATIGSGNSMNPVIAAIVGTALEQGWFIEHLQLLRAEYGRRMRAVNRVLGQGLPEGFACKYPGGGYFLWVVGPAGFDADRFNQVLMEQERILVLPGSRCRVKAESLVPLDTAETVDSCKNAFRVSIAYYEEVELVDAVTRLCKVLREEMAAP